MNREMTDGNARAIGATLRDARRRLGLEVREVEERTKIRARYIRALENEDWETLPAPAYVRGFLRTYGQLLGLDGEMLADEFRRLSADFEPAGGSPPSAEPLLSERRRPNERPRFSRGGLIIAVVAGLVVVLLLLSLLPGGDDEQPAGGSGEPGKTETKGKSSGKSKGDGDKNKPAPLQEVKLELETLTTVSVCLVADGSAVIDDQVLAAGTAESYDNMKKYRIDLTGGAVRVKIAGDSQKLESAEEGASFEADSRGIRGIGYAGPDCP